MQLIMYVGNDLIEAVPLDRERVPIPGYVGKIKRNLKEKHHSLLMEGTKEVEFIIVPGTE